jgi:PKD repeat protein
MPRTASALLLALLFVFALPAHSAQAQPESPGNVNYGLYGKLGVGLSDYTGDFPIQNLGHPLDIQEFTRGSGTPFVFDGELGYQFSSKWALAAGFQGGNYPIVGYAGPTISDSWRYTPHVLGRHTFGTPGESTSFYLDLGANVTFGGDDPSTSTGFGPSVGGGVDIPLSDALSFYVESRFHFTLPDDAIDGSADIGDTPASATTRTDDPSGSSTGPFDSVNQLLGFGLKFSLTTPVSPRVIALDAPTSVQTGESATYTATVNEDEADRPLSYRWQFGDGGTDSSRTASHTYNQPGTYTVTFTATNNVGEASQSLTVEVSPPPQPAQITSINATPNPVDVGETVRFSSNVQGDSPISREWSFDDGSSATGESPTHTYDEPGEYTARLQVSNEAGEDASTVTLQVERVLPEVCTTIGELNSAYFERNSSTLTDEARSSLQENTDVLSKCPNVSVRIEAFAAPGERNPQSLSEDRAEAVADFYQDNDVPDDRIETSGEGEVEGVTSKKGSTRQYRRADSIPEEDGGM